MTPALEAVKWVHHAGVCFEGAGKTIWVDPYQLKDGLPKADIIIITHAHSDHYSPEDIRRIMKDDTVFFSPLNVALKLYADMGIKEDMVGPLETGLTQLLGIGAEFTPVDARNMNHPLGSGFGIVLSLAGYSYYLSGDTDVLEVRAPCDVLFCVCDGKYNMPDYLNAVPREIRRMAKQPGLVVPYHYANADEPGNGEKLADALNALGINSAVFGA